MLHHEAQKLESELRATLGLNDAECIMADAMVRDMMRTRTFNPRIFQAAMMLLMSTYLATGDPLVGTGAADLSETLERMVALQKRVNALAQGTEEALQRLKAALALDPDLDETVPKEKLN